MIYELRAIHDTAKSFYRKAFISENENIIKLYSYNTYIGYIDIQENYIYLTGLYSVTTTRHIREFIAQNTGIKFISASDLSICVNNGGLYYGEN